ncbi:MAG: hypothetical protein U1E05_20830, partial [Patescibacteria group bacterium]|nr:hypothetical protein [Patescibacteria group bacterium]
LAGPGGGESDGMDDVHDYHNYERRRYIRRIIAETSPGDEAEQEGQEVTAASPGGLSYKVMVRALFGIAPAK